MDKQLRLIAGSIVVESKLSKGAKLQLLNFIQNEATDIQVKALLLDGKILTRIDEQTEEIINDRFKVSEAGGRVAKLRKTYMSRSATGMLLPAALWAIYRKIRSAYDICTKKCGTYELNTTRRQHCMIKCKVTKLKSQLASAKKAKNEKEIAKINLQLHKTNLALKKSISSFKGRGAESK